MLRNANINKKATIMTNSKSFPNMYDVYSNNYDNIMISEITKLSLLCDRTIEARTFLKKRSTVSCQWRRKVYFYKTSFFSSQTKKIKKNLIGNNLFPLVIKIIR